jgi:heavy metal sensor kinase
MSSKTARSLFGTVTFRLALWYAVMFAALAFVFVLLFEFAVYTSLRQRADRRLHEEARRLQNFERQHGLRALRDELGSEAELNGITRTFYVRLSPGMEVLAASDLNPWRGVDVRAVAQQCPVDGELYRSLPVPGCEQRVRVLARRDADGGALVIGDTREDDSELRERNWQTAATVLALMLACGGLVGWIVATRAMAGVKRVAAAATHIGRQDLSRRVPVLGEGTEIDELARAFNEMLERIQGLVTELKEVTDSIAHDLRSPVTRIRGLAETTLTGAPSLERYQDLAGAVVEDCDRLISMINTMLEIATTDAGVTPLPQTDVDLAAVARDAAELFQPVAEDRGVGLELVVGPEPLLTRGDPARLQRALANLVDNAIKYTPSGGRVSVHAEAAAAWITVAIADTGMGIAPEDLPRVFDRFFRGDRSRSAPGNGLGLSLARSIVQAHGGEITAASVPGCGSTFTLRLPRA